MQAECKTHRRRRHHRGSRYRRRIRGFSLAVYTLGALATIVICRALWMMFGG